MIYPTLKNVELRTHANHPDQPDKRNQPDKRDKPNR